MISRIVSFPIRMRILLTVNFLMGIVAFRKSISSWEAMCIADSKSWPWNG